MYHIKGGLSLDVTLGSYAIPDKMVSLVRLLITSDLTGLLPLVEIILVDNQGVLKKNVKFEDGMPIQVSVGRTNEKKKTYNFRRFNSKEQPISNHRAYKLTGYLDFPLYLSGSANGHFKATTSNAIQQIAQKCALDFEGDSTADTQAWFQQNMKYGEFVKYLAKHSYVDQDSLMVPCVTLDHKLLYKDFNKIGDGKASFAYAPSGSSDILIADHAPVDTSGSSNLSRGYKDTLYAQNLSAEETEKYTESSVKPRATGGSVNAGVQSQLDKSRVDISPAYHPDQVHDNYFKARHQNTRGGLLNSVIVDVLSLMQTDGLTLLSPCNLRLQNTNTPQPNEEIHDGSYIVGGKNIIVMGTQYAERYRLVRGGKNTKT